MLRALGGACVFVVVGIIVGVPDGRAASTAASDVQSCQPPAVDPSSEPNIFTEDQENHLGDAVAERLTRDFRVIDDAEVTTELRTIGEKLMKNVPASRLRLKYFLIELPEVNAFVLPGGRIYVSRKLISFAQSEDELAGVMAHELGHLLTRQQTIAVSRQFKNVLGVTSVGDRADIFDKYHQLLDNAARNPGAFKTGGGHDGKDQMAADRVGIFLLAGAGYQADAFASLYDRMSETKGKTGGFFSDLFGQTSPEARRLREAIKTTTALPAACVQPRPAGDAEFKRWQSLVIAYTPQPVKESLHGVVSRIPLTPPIRGEVTHLRFSPDGRYVLAQDDSGISVLTQSPFAPVFRIYAPEAERAQFSPDSTKVVFQTSDLRVERWDVGTRKRDSVHEVVSRAACLQTALSPDGKTLACVDGEFALTLFDVTSGAVVFQKKQFFELGLLQVLNLVFQSALGQQETDDPSFVTLGFSPDARYFAAGFRRPPDQIFQQSGQESVAVYDLQAQTLVALKGNAKRFMSTGFVFTAPDRITAVNPSNISKSGVIALPSGDVVEEAPMFAGELTAATKGRYVFVRPLQKYAVGVMDLARGEVTKGLITPAIDFYGDVFVAERGSGTVGLYSAADNQLRAEATLPPSSLGRLRATAVSPDLHWLAVSERSRGGVWDLTQGRRIFYSRGFRGAAIDGQGRTVVDIPKFRDEDRQLAQFDAAAGQPTSTTKFKNERLTQAGGVSIMRTPLNKNTSLQEGFVLDVRDARTSAALWTRKYGREFPQVESDPSSERVMLVWSASTPAIRSEVRREPALRTRLDALQELEGDYIVQVLDGRTGQTIGTVFVETGKGSFLLTGGTTSGDWVALQDSENRTRIYSLKTGELKGRVFGSNASVHGNKGLVALQNGTGRLTLYDAATLAIRDEFTFGQPVSYSAFSADGTKLLVLTSDHTAYVVEVAAR